MTDLNHHRQGSIQVLFLLASLLLVGKAMHLQLFSEELGERADATTIDRQVVFPARGEIYDRYGKPMVFNNPMYDLNVTYNQIDPDMDTTLFCELLGITKERFVEALTKDWRSGRFSKRVPFLFLDKIPVQTFARFQESLYLFPGFSAQLRNIRGYPYRSGAQILGFIREANPLEVKDSAGVYDPGDYIGAAGLEKHYEYFLRGQKGARLMLKDNLGREVGAYRNGGADIDPVAGYNLYTSIDMELQEYGELLMQNKTGSIVAIKPSTGEILAMVSSPSYDPSLLIINQDRGKNYQALNAHPLKPLYNRAVLAEYPPGSLFKSVVALVGMQEGVLAPNRTISCQGAYYFGGMRLTGCHGHPTCTSVSMAMQHSCNAYFVTVFRDIVDKFGYTAPDKGLGVFNGYLDKLSIGHRLQIDFPTERRGNYPSVAYFDKIFAKESQWKSIWIRSLGIGQGELLMTNMQMANVAAIIANRGQYYTPHFVSSMKNAKGETLRLNQYVQKHDSGIARQHFDPIIEGMERAVQMGTARAAFIPDIEICGKTGTAENNQGSKKDHSILFAFAPKNNPEIAIAVYVENAGFGGTYAAPISSLMIEKYIRREISEGRKHVEKRMLEAKLTDIP